MSGVNAFRARSSYRTLTVFEACRCRAWPKSMLIRRQLKRCFATCCFPRHHAIFPCRGQLQYGIVLTPSILTNKNIMSLFMVTT